ncbi:MAG: hypothetical protein K1000chlam2_01028 [Chlamydiae bacterium]|nr:hypothetical protein [Chlamydiota bacterium]
MRPKNLKFPFTWEGRRPALHEGVLIVPQYYQGHEKWVDEQHLFSNEKSISVEYSNDARDACTCRLEKT